MIHADITPEQRAILNRKSADAIQVGGEHYKTMAMQPWDVMEAVLTRDEFIGFLKGNIIKYTMRDGRKHDALHDADKAKHYRQKLAEILSNSTT